MQKYVKMTNSIGCLALKVPRKEKKMTKNDQSTCPQDFITTFATSALPKAIMGGRTDG